MNKVLSYFIILLKFVVPAFILRFPFLAVWGNYFLDIVDGDILLQLGLSDYAYQGIDKFADLVSYVFMLIAGSKWKIRKTVIVLFAYRFAGQIMFFATRNELWFFYFQNFLEPLLLIYTFLIFKSKSESKAYKIYKTHFKLIWAIIIVYKVWNEWYLHFANIDLSKLIFGFTGGEV